jgi:hypothetical protein
MVKEPRVSYHSLAWMATSLAAFTAAADECGICVES